MAQTFINILRNQAVSGALDGGTPVYRFHDTGNSNLVVDWTLESDSLDPQAHAGHLSTLEGVIGDISIIRIDEDSLKPLREEV